MNNFVNQLQELTKTAVEQQKKIYQLEQQAKKEKAIQDSNIFFNEYFSKWLIELANQGLSYILCRLSFEQNHFHSITFSKKTIPKSRKYGFVLFDATSPYLEFQIEDFLNIINKQNFSDISYFKDMDHPSTYFYLISWGANKYKCILEAMERENFYFPFSSTLKNDDNLNYDKKQEREKLTAGLRYDILKRDNYKCQICGRTQADGIKLHVDHIIPIAKGGKTVPENLQTLCQDCNLGKGTKDF